MSAIGAAARALPERVTRASWGTYAAVWTRDLGHLALLAAAGGLWAFSLGAARLDDMGGLGLLQALPWEYYAAFVLLLCGFGVAITRPTPKPWVLGLYVGTLIAVVHATAPLLYEEPRYSYVYKHIGVTNLIAATGHVDRGVDLFNNWPGLFASNAWLSTVGGVPPLSYAGWAEVFFGFADAAALQFLLRGMTRDPRIVWGATWLFVLGNWIGQDYLAPQALAFLLTLVALGLCLRGNAPPVRTRTRLGRRRDELLRRIGADTHGDPHAGLPLPIGWPATVALILLFHLAVVVTHQLTPVILVATVFGLAVAKRLPLWLPAVLAGIEVAWVARAWPFLSGRFTLLHFDPLARPTAGITAATGSKLSLFVLTSWASAGILLLFTLLGAAGAMRRWKAGARDLAPFVLIAAPIPVLGAQSYNGEAPLRLFLFSLPSLAFFAAAVCVPRPAATARAAWRPCVAGIVLGACLLPAFFGRELVNHFTPGEVRASTWLERHAPAGTLVMYMAGANFPDRLTARYAQLNNSYEGVYWPSLSDLPQFPARRLGRRDLPAIEAVLRSRRAAHVWFVLSPGQERFARLYGRFEAGTTASLASAMSASPAFRGVYRRDGVWIFALAAEGSRR
jgi:hypothetical protein